MLNLEFGAWETIKVIFMNEKEIILKDIKKIKEDDSGYIHFIDLYGDELLTVNGSNMIGFMKQ